MIGINNPVLPGFYPDPSVCRAGSDYYLVTSTFEYFPGVPIFHSRDLVSWKQIGHCLNRSSQLNLYGRRSSEGIFAPTLRHHDGTLYMITTDVGGSGHFFVTAQDPAGPWSDPVYVNGPGFDPDLFFDDDGKVYFSREDITGHGIRQQEIDLKSGKLLSEERLIWEGLEDQLCEAPHIYKIDGIYYLLVAEGGTGRGHMAVIARGPNPWGPFTSCPHNPILTHRHRITSPVQSTGHGDLIQKKDGSWWMVFLATRPVRKWHHLGRETFLAPVEWRDGWPVVNRNEEIACGRNLRADEHQTGVSSQGRLLPPWNVRGVFDTRRIQVPRSGDGVVLVPGHTGIGVTTGSAFVGRRQTSFHCTFSASLTAPDLKPGEEAGITALMNETHYCCASLSMNAQGDKEIIMRRRIGSLDAVTRRIPVPRGTASDRELVLSVHADEHWYTFRMVSPESGKNIDIDRAETRYLSTEVAGGFTGVYLGLYGASQSPSETAVRFSKVRIT